MNFRGLKAVSIMLIFSLVLQEISYATEVRMVDDGLWMVDHAKEKQKNLGWAKKLLPKIPESVATLEDAWHPSTIHHPRSTILLIQDAHTNESGQRNLSKLLKVLFENEKGLNYVFSEAGEGDNSLSFLRKLGTPESRQRAADKFLREGILHGHEAPYLTGNQDFILWGVEDMALYRKSVENYSFVARDREKLENYIRSIGRALTTLKPSLVNPLLGSFLSARETYLDNKISLKDYEQYLEAQARLCGFSLKKYPHLSILKRLRRTEEALKPDASKTDGAVYKKQLALVQRLKAKEALREMKSLEEAIEQCLTLSKDEQIFIHGQQLIRLLEKLIHFQLTPEEYQALGTPMEWMSGAGVVDQSRSLAGFLNQKIMTLRQGYEDTIFLDANFEEKITRALNFYELTFQRDERFVENILKADGGWRMEDGGEKRIVDGRERRIEGRAKDKFSSKIKFAEGEQVQSSVLNPPSSIPQRPKVVVLVAGGYHTPNLKQLLQSKGISYVVLTPRIEKETNLVKYEKILLEQLKLSAPTPNIFLKPQPQTTMTMLLGTPGNGARLGRISEFIESAATASESGIGGEFSRPRLRSRGDLAHPAHLTAQNPKNAARLAEGTTKSDDTDEYAVELTPLDIEGRLWRAKTIKGGEIDFNVQKVSRSTPWVLRFSAILLWRGVPTDDDFWLSRERNIAIQILLKSVRFAQRCFDWTLGLIPDFLFFIPSGLWNDFNDTITVFLTDEKSGKLAGVYEYWPDSNYLESGIVQKKYRGTGAVDILFEDIKRCVRKGEIRSRQHSSIARISPKVRRGGDFFGTADELKNALGIRSKVTINAPLSATEAKLMGPSGARIADNREKVAFPVPERQRSHLAKAQTSASRKDGAPIDRVLRLFAARLAADGETSFQKTFWRIILSLSVAVASIYAFGKACGIKQISFSWWAVHVIREDEGNIHVHTVNRFGSHHETFPLEQGVLQAKDQPTVIGNEERVAKKRPDGARLADWEGADKIDAIALCEEIEVRRKKVLAKALLDRWDVYGNLSGFRLWRFTSPLRFHRWWVLRLYIRELENMKRQMLEWKPKDFTPFPGYQRIEKEVNKINTRITEIDADLDLKRNVFGARLAGVASGVGSKFDGGSSTKSDGIASRKATGDIPGTPPARTAKHPGGAARLEGSHDSRKGSKTLSVSLETVFVNDKDLPVDVTRSGATQEFVNGQRDVFGNRRMNFDEDNSGFRTDGEVEKVMVAHKDDGFFRCGQNQNLPIIGFIGWAEYLVFLTLKILLRVAGNVVVEDKSQEMAVLSGKGDKFAALDLLGREVKGRLYVLWSQLGEVFFGSDFTHGNTSLKKLEDLPHHDTSVFEAWLAVANILRNCYQALFRIQNLQTQGEYITPSPNLQIAIGARLAKFSDKGGLDLNRSNHGLDVVVACRTIETLELKEPKRKKRASGARLVGHASGVGSKLDGGSSAKSDGIASRKAKESSLSFAHGPKTGSDLRGAGTDAGRLAYLSSGDQPTRVLPMMVKLSDVPDDKEGVGARLAEEGRVGRKVLFGASEAQVFFTEDEWSAWDQIRQRLSRWTSSEFEKISLKNPRSLLDRMKWDDNFRLAYALAEGKGDAVIEKVSDEEWENFLTAFFGCGYSPMVWSVIPPELKGESRLRMGMVILLGLAAIHQTLETSAEGDKLNKRRIKFISCLIGASIASVSDILESLTSEIDFEKLLTLLIPAAEKNTYPWFSYIRSLTTDEGVKEAQKLTNDYYLKYQETYRKRFDEIDHFKVLDDLVNVKPEALEEVIASAQKSQFLVLDDHSMAWNGSLGRKKIGYVADLLKRLIQEKEFLRIHLTSDFGPLQELSFEEDEKSDDQKKMQILSDFFSEDNANTSFIRFLKDRGDSMPDYSRSTKGLAQAVLFLDALKGAARKDLLSVETGLPPGMAWAPADSEEGGKRVILGRFLNETVDEAKDFFAFLQNETKIYAWHVMEDLPDDEPIDVEDVVSAVLLYSERRTEKSAKKVSTWFVPIDENEGLNDWMGKFIESGRSAEERRERLREFHIDRIDGNADLSADPVTGVVVFSSQPGDQMTPLTPTGNPVGATPPVVAAARLTRRSSDEGLVGRSFGSGPTMRSKTKLSRRQHEDLQALVLETLFGRENFRARLPLAWRVDNSFQMKTSLFVLRRKGNAASLRLLDASGRAGKHLVYISDYKRQMEIYRRKPKNVRMDSMARGFKAAEKQALMQAGLDLLPSNPPVSAPQNHVFDARNLSSIEDPMDFIEQFSSVLSGMHLARKAHPAQFEKDQFFIAHINDLPKDRQVLARLVLGAPSARGLAQEGEGVAPGVLRILYVDPKALGESRLIREGLTVYQPLLLSRPHRYQALSLAFVTGKAVAQSYDVSSAAGGSLELAQSDIPHNLLASLRRKMSPGARDLDGKALASRFINPVSYAALAQVSLDYGMGPIPLGARLALTRLALTEIGKAA